MEVLRISLMFSDESVRYIGKTEEYYKKIKKWRNRNGNNDN